MKISHFVIFLLAICFCLNCTLVFGQDNNWRTHLQQLAEEGMDEEALDNIYQELLMLESNPINLNNVNFFQLERFPLLSYEQAVSLIDFLEKNRPVYTVFELRNVPLFDFKTVELVLPFFVAGEMEVKRLSIGEMFKHGRHEIINRFDKTVTKRAGYREYSDSILQRYPNRKYQGEDFYTSLKYSFSYRDKIQYGFLGEKDAGEPFFKKNYSKGYDHYGFHFIVRDIGPLKTVAVGDYRISFGQGLILNNDFVLSKSWVSSNIIRRTLEPKRHFSTAESGFFRGVSAVYQLKNVAVTALYSNKMFDANLSKSDDITSFKTDGYHRTLSEIEKKNNTREQVVGVNINWRRNSIQVGASAIYHKYNRMLNPTFQDYNIFYLRDSSNYNMSIDYSYRFSRLTVAGETAIAPNKAIATLNIIQYNTSYLYSFSLLHRYLPASYNALHAKAFAESSRIQNENGFYFGTSFKPIRNTSITAYIDVFKFPWLKYQVDMPSKGVDFYLLADYALNRVSNLEFRYKYKQKEKNAYYPENVKTILPYSTQKFRVRYINNQISGWSFRTTMDLANYSLKHSEEEWGYMISQGISYRSTRNIQGDFYAGFFSSDSYAARLYSYERNIMSTFYMPSFYGEGIRLSLSGRYRILSSLSLSLKLGYTNYFDRNTIGSGTELIDGSSRLDVFSLIQWKF